jgi:hypothetical protein
LRPSSRLSVSEGSGRTLPDGGGIVQGAVRSWLRLEGLGAFLAGLVLFGVSGGSWLFVIPLVLLPDASVVGYLASPRVGAFTYNLLHTWAPGFIALALGLWLASESIQLVASILIVHVGMDRALGYGLKLPSSFQDTHLGRIGRTSRRPPTHQPRYDG